MKPPKNHHYVSECQIRNFWNKNDNKIWLYDKELDRFYFKISPKSMFSEIESNSRREENGEIDHATLEHELRDHFETPYTPSLRRIQSALESGDSCPEFEKEDLLILGRYGIAGLMRTPTAKSETDGVMRNIFFETLLPIASPELKVEIEELERLHFSTKHTNTVSYLDMVDSIIERMGEVFFQIIQIKTEDYFILPDFPSFGWRAKINTYFNPEVYDYAQIGVPLTSKLYLHMESKKLRNKEGGIFEITDQRRVVIDMINKEAYDKATKTIACESEKYLRNFVVQQKQRALIT